MAFCYEPLIRTDVYMYRNKSTVVRENLRHISLSSLSLFYLLTFSLSLYLSLSVSLCLSLTQFFSVRF